MNSDCFFLNVSYYFKYFEDNGLWPSSYHAQAAALLLALQMAIELANASESAVAASPPGSSRDATRTDDDVRSASSALRSLAHASPEVELLRRQLEEERSRHRAEMHEARR